MAVRRAEHFEGEVRDLGSSGHGIVAHPSGRVFFVPGVWVGERGEFEITELKGRSGHARLIRLSESSPSRITPPCLHHGFNSASCGGCPWQFMDYAEQLRAKAQRVQRAVAKLDAAAVVQDIWGSPDVLGYRNRAQFKTDGKRLGYVAAGSRSLVDIDDCLVLNEANRQTLSELRAQLPNPQWRAPRGRDWTTLEIDDDLRSADIESNQRTPFRQGNSAQNTRMQAWLAQQLGTGEVTSPVVELFAGAGNFTQVMVEQGFGQIVAVDSFGPAIATLESRSYRGVVTRHQDLWRAGAAQALATELAAARTLVLDPPRDGLKTIDDFLQRCAALQKIIYISCDVATWARDAGIAARHGFALEQVQPLDLFPQTPHVELLTVLSRDSLP